MLDKLINRHQPVLLEEIKTYIPKERKINVIDATFGGGGYSRSILQNFNVEHLIELASRIPFLSKIFPRS